MLLNYPRKDLIGQSFNGLTVVSFKETDSEGYDTYNCDCHCGNKTVARGKSIKKNRVRTCGCNTDYDNLTGRKFGHLTVVGSAASRRSDRYLVNCVCGTGFEVMGTQIRHGYVLSCGCKREVNEMDSRYYENKLTDLSKIDEIVLNKSRGLIFKLYRGKMGINIQDVKILPVERYYDIEVGLKSATKKELKVILDFYQVKEENFEQLVTKISKQVKVAVINIGMDSNMTIFDLIDTVIFNIINKASKT